MRLVVLFSVVFLLLSTAAGQDRLIPFHDISEHGSPLRLSVSAAFGDYQEAGMSWACKAKVSARNVSAKPILVLVVGFNHHRPQDDESYPVTFSEHYFFSTPMTPGDTLDWNQLIAWTGTLGKHEVHVHEDEISIYAEVLFVKFADGAVWGDPDEASLVLQQMKDSLNELKDLVSIYESYGTAALVSELKQNGASARSILKQQYGDDPNTIGLVVDKMYEMLRHANENLTALHH